MSNIIRWIQLSDIHFQFANYDTVKFRDRLVEHLKKLRKSIDYDFLIITGDVTYKNKGYDVETIRFIYNIAASLLIEKRQIFIVPGNHDLHRSGLRAEILKGLFSENNDKLSDKADGMFHDDSIFKPLQADFNDYSKFEAELLGRPSRINELHFVEEGENYRIIHLNTCFLSGQNGEEGKLLIGCSRIYDTLKSLKHDNKKVNIAIGHHSLECFIALEKKRILNDFLTYNIDLYLCGHSHEPQYAKSFEGERTIHSFVCGSNIVDDFSKTCFISGQIDINTGEGKVEFHTWDDKDFTWYIDHSVKGPETANMEYVFKLDRIDGICVKPVSAHIRKPNTTEIEIVAKTYPEVKSYIKRKIAPSDLAESPFLLESKRFELADVVKSHKRVVLLGDAGSGKSTELRHLAWHYSQGADPVYVFFHNLNVYVNDKIEDLLPQGWSSIASDKILVILDGFDEIESKNKNDAIRRIETFSSSNPDVRVVISCRSNFYRSKMKESSGTLKDFETYKILGLDSNQIDEYIKSVLPQKHVDFWRESAQCHLNSLLCSPFYLTYMVKLFLLQNKLPATRASLFEQFINELMNMDQEHFKNTLDFEAKKPQIWRTLEQIALSMELLERNYIADEELAVIVPEEQNLIFAKCCSIFKKGVNPNTTWGFEHNNFQEYLAARALISQSLDKIKDFLAFGPDYVKTKPSWANTLAFMIDLEQGKGLMEWILAIEPELAIKFEPDKLSNRKRKGIFLQIFNYYKLNQIPLDTEKYNLADFSRFCQIEEIVSVLVHEIEDGDCPSSTENALLLLSRMRVHSCEKQVGKVVLEMLQAEKLPTQVSINRALMILRVWKLDTEENLNMVVDHYGASASDWVRYGLYELLGDSAYVDNFTDVFLDGIQYIRDRKDSRLGNESFSLSQGLLKIKKAAGIEKILAYFTINPTDPEKVFYGEKFAQFVSNAVDASKESDTLDKMATSFFIVLVKAHEDAYKYAFSKYFHKTGRTQDAFIQILKSEIEGYYKYEALALLLDGSIVPVFVRQYEEREITNSDVERLIISVRIYDKSLAGILADEANKVCNRFELPKEVDYDSLRKEQARQDFKLLFDMDCFLAKIKQVFDVEGKSEFQSDELLSLKNYRWDNPEYSYQAYRLLNRLTPCTYENAQKTISAIWDSWSRSQIYEYLSNENFSVDEKEKQIISRWCLEHCSKVDVKNTFVENEDGGYSVIDKDAIYLWFYLRKFDLVYPPNVLLDLISFDWLDRSGFAGISYLEKILPLRDMTERVQKNLGDGIENSRVLDNHIDFCMRHGINSVVKIALDLIADEKSNVQLRETALQAFCVLSNSLEPLVQLLQSLSPTYKWKVIDELINRGYLLEKVKEHLKELLIGNNEEIKLNAADYLIKMQDLEGLTYYVDWMYENNRMPRNLTFDWDFKSINQREALCQVMKLLALSYKPDFVQDKYERLNSIVLQILTQIAFANEDNYLVVKKAIEDFIVEKSATIPHVKGLLYFQDSLERRYYIGKSDKLSITEVMTKINNLSSSSSY